MELLQSIEIMNTRKSHGLPALLHPDLAGFVETVRLGTVSAAAQALGISQPALSARLSRLAASTGDALFSRAGRLLTLTAHGARVHDGALRVLRSCEAMDASVRGHAGDLLPLRVGTSDAVPKVVVRRILAPYLRAGIAIHCREWASEHLELELLSHRLDLLITDREPVAIRGEDLASSVAGRSEIVLCAKRSRASRLRREFPECLAEHPLGLPAAPSPLRERIDRWLRRHAPDARIALEAEDRALLHHFAQIGLAVVPVARATAAQVEAQFGLAQIAELKGVDESYYTVGSRSRVPDLAE